MAFCEWRPVKGYEQYYQVNSMGEVRSLDRDVWNGLTFYRKPGRIRKPVLNKANGYLMLVLCDLTTKKSVYVHRIVAEAFVEGYQPGMVVNHKNEIKTDNRAQNLEWCTVRENNNYNGKSQIPNKPVIQISGSGEVVRIWTSAREASGVLDIEFRNISACCHGHRNSAGGYGWRFFHGESDSSHGGKRVGKNNVNGASTPK